MINVLVPLAGGNQFFSEYPYPKPLIELCGKTMIQHVVENLNTITKEKQFIFIVNSEDCKKYHLDNVLNLLSDQKCKIIKVDNTTKGAACSALLAIEHINSETPLVIANADQKFDISLDQALQTFEDCDAGVITFESVHPRWSYVRLNGNNEIIETAEKRPISKNAIAGFYYFKKGSDFCQSAMDMIKKDANVNDLYFIAPSMNELVLKNKTLKTFSIESQKYHSFYSPTKIKEYERQQKC